MALLDPTTNVGKMRLRVGDYSDLPIMPDAVYLSALEDCSGSVPRACVLMAQYILASLTGQTHQKLAQIEVFGAEWFNNYLAFVKATILNPHLMQLSPMPYVATVLDEFGCKKELPLIEFQHDWNKNYISATASQTMHRTASIPYFGYSNGASYF